MTMSSPVSPMNVVWEQNQKTFKKMDDVLSNMHRRLTTLEEEILPVYYLTERASTSQRNIEETMAQLMHMTRMFTMSQVVEHDLQQVKSHPLKFQKAMHQLEEALEELKRHRDYKSSDEKIHEILATYQASLKRCRIEFGILVGSLPNRQRQRDASHGLSTRFSMFLHEEDEAFVEGKKDEFDSKGMQNKMDLARVLGQVLLQAHDELWVQEYSGKRQEILKHEREKRKVQSPLLNEEEATFSLGEEKMNEQMINGSTHDVNFAATWMEKHRSSITEGSRMVTESVESLERLLCIFHHEKAIAQEILDDRHAQHQCFTGAIEQELKLFCESMEEDLKQRMGGASGEQPTLDKICRALELYQAIKDKCSDMYEILRPPLESPDTKTFSKENRLVEYYQSFDGLVAALSTQMLHNFRHGINIRSSFGKLVSKDGNVHRMTSNVVNCIRRMFELKETVNLLLSETQPKNDATTAVAFVDSLLVALIDFLQNKSTAYKQNVILSCLFLLNNFFYVQKALFPTTEDTNRGEENCFRAICAEVRQKVMEIVVSSRKLLILNAFQTIENVLTDPRDPLVYQRGSKLLTLESGRQLKERFAGFNEHFDSLCNTMRFYNVPDPGLRSALILSAREILVPRYTAFYEKYAIIPFSKKKQEKYLKYTPKKVDDRINDFFAGQTPSTQ